MADDPVVQNISRVDARNLELTIIPKGDWTPGDGALQVGHGSADCGGGRTTASAVIRFE